MTFISPPRKSIRQDISMLCTTLNTTRGLGYELLFDRGRIVWVDKATGVHCYEAKPNENGYWAVGVLNPNQSQGEVHI